MAATDTYLKTRQVADALGVSVSSIKRWVDSGVLEATRTQGRHRLVSLSSALEFARRVKLPAEGLLHLSADSIDARSDAEVREALLVALKAGDAGEARRLLISAYRSDRRGDGLADRIVQPVLATVGHAWMLGSWDVYEEHLATQIIILAVNELIARVSSDPVEGRPLALGGSIEGDHYALPGLLGELVLREVGWDVRNLGYNLPLRSFARAIRDHKPGLVFLPVGHVADREAFLRDYAFFYEAATLSGSAVILGGRALDPELRSKLIYASFGDRMVHLAEFARRLLPPARPIVETEAGHPSSSPNLD